MKIEKARMSDIPKMHQLINYFAERGEMLPRALSEMYENIRDFFVARNDKGETVGCVALHVNWSDLAEVKSLAVSRNAQGKGVGTELVRACVDEARELGINTVFCLTYKPDFFEKVGFRREDKAKLPRKVWTECYRCPKFPDCDEVALVYDGKTKKTARARRS
jgi:amino-acid N-acetyltransferase